jgi:hypothetical protein
MYEFIRKMGSDPDISYPDISGSDPDISSEKLRYYQLAFPVNTKHIFRCNIYRNRS